MLIEPFSLALARPLVTSRGPLETREGFLVRVEHRGTPGVGEATPLPGWTESLGECRLALADAATGPDPEAALDDLEGTPAARHGLALALADARARADGVPLYRYLGRDGRVERVPANATVGEGAPRETARAAERAVAEGFRCVKVKVGARAVGADVERLRAVRDAVGVDLRADANGAWTRDEAGEAFDAFADLGIEYVEQPLAPDDLDGHAALRDGPVGVALDETLATMAPEAVLAADAADVLILKPMVLGGPDRARKAAKRARAAGVTPVVTTTIDGAVARAGAVHLAASIPGVPACGLATGDRLAEDLVPDPAPVEDGGVRVPQGPGSVTGVEFGTD